MPDEYVKYLYTDLNYQVLDVRGKKTEADAVDEANRLASILKQPIGCFRLLHVAGSEYHHSRADESSNESKTP